MPLPKLVIFDDGKGRFGPLTRLQPVAEMRTGVLTTAERIRRRLGRSAEERVDEADVLFANARWAGGPPLDASMIELLASGQAIVQTGEQVVAARLRPADARAFADNGHHRLPRGVQRLELDDIVLIDRPWQVLDHLPRNLAYDLSLFHHPIAPDAAVHPTAVIDAMVGPVVIDSRATIDPFVVLEGPCYIGAGAVIRSHAHIRPYTVIGPSCIIGGEVNHSIIDGYTNKAHAGYLGHSLVGRWVNLGADTNTSNLKNTWGRIRAQLDPDAPAEDTGRTKLGSIIGDHVHTAIGTRLLTGSVIDVGSMIACSAFAPKTVPPLSFITDRGVERYDVEKLLVTVQAVMRNKDTEPDPAVIDALRALAASV